MTSKTLCYQSENNVEDRDSVISSLAVCTIHQGAIVLASLVEGTTSFSVPAKNCSHTPASAPYQSTAFRRPATVSQHVAAV